MLGLLLHRGAIASQEMVSFGGRAQEWLLANAYVNVLPGYVGQTFCGIPILPQAIMSAGQAIAFAPTQPYIAVASLLWHGVQSEVLKLEEIRNSFGEEVGDLIALGAIDPSVPVSSEKELANQVLDRLRPMSLSAHECCFLLSIFGGGYRAWDLPIMSLVLVKYHEVPTDSPTGIKDSTFVPLNFATSASEVSRLCRADPINFGWTKTLDLQFPL